MKTLKVKLKQHTPLIHFQHDQYGATLRASEVKPKLDKYIISVRFNNDFKLVKSFLIRSTKESDEDLRKKFDNGFRALNYKIKIKARNVKEIALLCEPKEKFEVLSDSKRRVITKYVAEDFPMVLSNMGGKDNPSELVNLVLHDDVILDIISSDDKLINEVKDSLSRFFATTNFGQRASKGFGSFTVVEINDEFQKWIHGEMYPVDTPFFKYKQVAGDSYDRMKVLFNVIDFYWRCLKSGINYTKRKKTDSGITRTGFKVGNEYRYAYIKSYLWKYLNNRIKGYTWEKRKIKEELNLIGIATIFDNIHEENSNDYFFARGLMGCSTESIQYRIPRGEWELNKKNKKSEKFDKVEVKISNSNTHNKSDKIERIASPIFFKPVLREVNGCEYVYVYILFDDNLIEKLNNVASDYIFNFSANGSNVNMRLKPVDFRFNYTDLIKSYHSSFYNDKDVFESIFRIPFDKRTDGHKFKMIARDFNWNNILDVKDENALISFGRVSK